MEHLSNNKPEDIRSQVEHMGKKEKLEAILPLFGTDEARETFIQNCKDYIEARNKAVRESYAPEVSVRRIATFSSPKQATIHNWIMGALTRLASQSLAISPIQAEILREMHDRDVTADILKEYVAAAGLVRENEEENQKNKERMSETAYYHSLGED